MLLWHYLQLCIQKVIFNNNECNLASRHTQYLLRTSYLIIV